MWIIISVDTIRARLLLEHRQDSPHPWRSRAEAAHVMQRPMALSSDLCQQLLNSNEYCYYQMLQIINCILTTSHGIHMSICSIWEHCKCRRKYRNRRGRQGNPETAHWLLTLIRNFYHCLPLECVVRLPSFLLQVVFLWTANHIIKPEKIRNF